MKQNRHKTVRTMTASTLVALATLGGIFTGTGCASPDTQHTASAALGPYQTFGFGPITGSNGRAISLAQDEVSRQLMARGLMPSSNPDLLVNVQVRANPAVRMPGTTYLGRAHANINHPTDGHLTIDLKDVRQNHLVWRGHTSHPITRQVLDNPQRSMDRAVVEAFRSFPPHTR